MQRTTPNPLDKAREALSLLTPNQRRDLARFLDASDETRADLVRQCFERGHQPLGEIFIDLEANRSAAGFMRLAIESMEPLE
jgi:hypothetical protein